MGRQLMNLLPKLIFLTTVCLQSASPSPSGSLETARGLESSDQGLMSGIRVLYRTYERCEQQEDMLACLKLKALRFADRALKVKSIPLIDGVEVVKKAESEDSRRLSEPLVEVSEEDLPADAEKRQETLDDFLIDRLSRFLRTHTIKFSLPKFIGDLNDNTGDMMIQEGELEAGIISSRVAVTSTGSSVLSDFLSV